MEDISAKDLSIIEIDEDDVFKLKMDDFDVTSSIDEEPE